MSPRTRDFIHEGHRLVYDEYGSGERVIVLLPGLLFSRKMHQPLAEALAERGVIARGAVAGDLFDLCQGVSQGRRSSAEITLYKNGGGGHLDLFVARHLMARLDAEPAGESP